MSLITALFITLWVLVGVVGALSLTADDHGGAGRRGTSSQVAVRDDTPRS